MFNDTSSPLAFLRTRRSGKPRDMIAPGPNGSQLRTILETAMRVPDHGKLSPWRFIIVDQDRRAKLAALLSDAYLAERPSAAKAEIDAMVQFARQAPVLVVVMSTPQTTSKIPKWEQELSAGAACMNLLAAAGAVGFVGGWLTGWPAYSDAVRDAFGGPNDRIAGFIFIGSPGRDFEERPRPAYDSIVTNWT